MHSGIAHQQSVYPPRNSQPLWGTTRMCPLLRLSGQQENEGESSHACDQTHRTVQMRAAYVLLCTFRLLKPGGDRSFRIW